MKVEKVSAIKIYSPITFSIVGDLYSTESLYPDVLILFLSISSSIKGVVPR